MSDQDKRLSLGHEFTWDGEIETELLCLLCGQPRSHHVPNPAAVGVGVPCRVCQTQEAGLPTPGYIHDPNCQKAGPSETKPMAWTCKARTANVGANTPQECDWPFCGCDPYADKVLAALEESGYELKRRETKPMAAPLEPSTQPARGDDSRSVNENGYERLKEAEARVVTLEAYRAADAKLLANMPYQFQEAEAKLKELTRLAEGLAELKRLAEDLAMHGCACDWEVGAEIKTGPPNVECSYHTRVRQEAEAKFPCGHPKSIGTDGNDECILCVTMRSHWQMEEEHSKETAALEAKLAQAELQMMEANRGCAHSWEREQKLRSLITTLTEALQAIANTDAEQLAPTAEWATCVGIARAALQQAKEKGIA